MQGKFRGKVTPDGFRITRIIYYRNSFLPVVTGRFLPSDSGVNVRIRMRLNALAMAFSCVWCAGIAYFISLVIAAVLSGKFEELCGLPIGLGMLALGWGLASAGFWLEVKKQKPMLVQMFTELDEASHRNRLRKNGASPS